MNPDPYRGVFGSDGEKYAKDVEDLIKFGTSGHVAGFMSEAIQVKKKNLTHFLCLKTENYTCNKGLTPFYAKGGWWDC